MSKGQHRYLYSKNLANATITTTIEEELLIIQHIPVFDGNSCYGEFVSYDTYTGETTQWEGQDGKTYSGYLGTGYYFFYGETDKAAAGMATYIAESFKVITESESNSTGKPPVVDESTEDLTKYGLPEGVILPAEATWLDVKGNLKISVENSTDEEMIVFIDGLTSEVEFSHTYKNIEIVMDGTGIISATKQHSEGLHFAYQYNGQEYAFNIRYSKDNYTITVIKKE